MSIIELEKSDNLMDRIAYANKLKEFIIQCEKRVLTMQWDMQHASRPSETVERILQNHFPELRSTLQENLETIKQADIADGDWWSTQIKREEELIKKLKIKLSEYDVYRQKEITRCATCKEFETKCLCAILGPLEQENLDVLKPNMPF